ncbi:hypothetical protein [Rugamonas rubra]|uniref:Proline-rich protein n=1 Tax=Rugamonas rubra TaxID=758825 RepID=A0A1I4QED9_9BURK|nr:hypothetical protein [Rugamonas rubra]SFM37993.1 hypothetical protein SAMN02982985_03847 [Rugamonas rubra]
MDVAIYDKTDKGRDEIATRRHRLAPRLRTLLVMVDGRRSDGALLAGLAPLGLGADDLATLLAQDYIRLARRDAVAVPLAPASPPEAAAPAPAAVAAAGSAAGFASDSAPGPALDSPPAATATAVTPARARQFQALCQFFNGTIKRNIGLRGLALQLKVEHAANVDELRALRQPFLDAVHKAKGGEVAQRLRAELDELLDNGPPDEPA